MIHLYKSATLFPRGLIPGRPRRRGIAAISRPFTLQTTDNEPLASRNSRILFRSSLLLRFRSLFDIVIPFVAGPAPTRAASPTTRVRWVANLRPASAKLVPSIAARSFRSAESTTSIGEPIAAPFLWAPTTSGPMRLIEYSRSNASFSDRHSSRAAACSTSFRESISAPFLVAASTSSPPFGFRISDFVLGPPSSSPPFGFRIRDLELEAVSQHGRRTGSSRDQQAAH
jgi:hypothetical protein